MKQNLSRNNNEDNFANYEDRNDPNFRRGKDQHKIKNWLHETNWEIESQYHNTYYHGNSIYGRREIKMNNKEYLENVHEN